MSLMEGMWVTEWASFAEAPTDRPEEVEAQVLKLPDTVVTGAPA